MFENTNKKLYKPPRVFIHKQSTSLFYSDQTRPTSSKYIINFTAASLLVTAATAAPLQTTAGQDLCCATNTLRATNNAPALLWSPNLDKIAQGHSNYMQAYTLLTNIQDPGTSIYDLYGRLDTTKYAYTNATQHVSLGFALPNKFVGAWEMLQSSKYSLINSLSTMCGGAVANSGAYYTSVMVFSQGNPAVYSLVCNGGVTGAGSEDSHFTNK